MFLNRQIRDCSAALGATLYLPLSASSPNGLAQQDLIFAERERLLREPVDRAIPLVEAVNSNLFARLDILDASALATLKQADAAKANAIEARVRGRTGDGFGIMMGPNMSSALGQVTADAAETHTAIPGQLIRSASNATTFNPSSSPTSRRSVSRADGSCS